MKTSSLHSAALQLRLETALRIAEALETAESALEYHLLLRELLLTLELPA